MQAQLGGSLSAPPQADQLLLPSLRDRRKCLLELGPGLWSAELLCRTGTTGPFPRKAQEERTLYFSLPSSPGTAAIPISSQRSAVKLINIAGVK